MDPVTAVGLAASVIHTAKEIGQSTSGLTHDDQRMEDVTKAMHKLSRKLETPDTTRSNEHERGLQNLASECRKLSLEILELLKKTSAKNSSSMFEATTVHHTKIEVCKREVAEIRNRLLSLTTHTETQSNTIIRNLDASRNQLRSGLSSLSSFGEDILMEIQKVVQLPQAVKEAIARNQIMRLLYHPDLHRRFDSVDKAHFETFRWILEDEASVKSNHVCERRKLFRTWLSQENGIFHIAGKLGSGKSTLTDFILGHPNTIGELRKWAGMSLIFPEYAFVSPGTGDRRLALVSFFFWRIGTEWQNSMKALRRGLVYDLLKECPELIHIAFPSLWQDIVESLPCQPNMLPFREAKVDSIRDDTVEDAFNTLLHANIHRTHRICFSIDALDEQADASLQNDHQELVEMIASWVSSSPGLIKVCVSSREENVFFNAFDPNKRLRLQDLTQRDTRQYAWRKLSDVASMETNEHIIEKIMLYSNGIFLWVVLVMNELRKSIQTGLGVSDFEATLDSLPRQLDALFQAFAHIHPRAKERKCIYSPRIDDSAP
ncbi:hypothetical protein N0V90_004105 [Kalmusia sp. IMI 367209]|nr:hypothetical protein N0V90_004105 [Kalmusia sp. IMI 367209]